MKIWAMVYRGDKIIKDALYEFDGQLAPKSYTAALQEIAYLLDIATPVSLPVHLDQLKRFNRVKYLPRDFIEEVDFTSVALELVKEDAAEKQSRNVRSSGQGWSPFKDGFF